ncbi:MAG: helix-turn-helix domain-containing protein [Ruminococcus sp.]|nr:helix-turn-helix domain-containing protein [Ruminococcus sp.]
MIFADKLIQLRKKAGWSQEELAEQMNVSRQSVSKWEGAQSVPDLEKMIHLSRLFGVSTDYLLKDEIDGIDEIKPVEEEATSIRKVSMEDANAYLSAKEQTSKLIANGVFLYILSPICLLILAALSESPDFNLAENTAAGIGVSVWIILVAIAAAIFVFCGSKIASFKYLEKGVFETEYGVRGMVEERKAGYKDTYTKSNVIGVFLCIVSILPLFGGIIINEENDLLMICMVSVMIAVIGIGVTFFVRSSTIQRSFERLLQEGDFEKKRKKQQPIVDAFTSIYWLAVTATYLAVSFTKNNWEISWIVWVISGLLYPAIVAAINAAGKEK